MTENAPTLEDIELTIAELETYRERFVNDTLALAKRARISKKEAQEQLTNHPEVAKIDAALVNLRARKEGFSS
ncbi:MAG: acetyltransferase [Cyanobacteria bacterium P01_D01_bin.123]